MSQKRLIGLAMISAEYKIGRYLYYSELIRDFTSKKYLIAMVFAYFKRAKLTIRQFTRLNFFLALFLAHDMEEDEEELKHKFLPWVLGNSWRQKLPQFLKKREKFWRILEHRSVVSRKCCLELMSIQPANKVWQRERVERHAGANRQYPDKQKQYRTYNMPKQREEVKQHRICKKTVLNIYSAKDHNCSLNSLEDTDDSTNTNFHLSLSSSTSEASSSSLQSEPKTITLS
ncbi:speedy protein A-like, partial [Limulus polyphemus]|uniref:Speedy protein A-like n=1 Tax=Limulus polyphemus TaxID=6850 RepID=A0ABM1BU84_LIMPO